VSADPRMLTPAERAKLPPCKRHFFGRCDSADKADAEFCLKCDLEGALQSLQHRDIASAVMCIDSVIVILKEMKVID